MSPDFIKEVTAVTDRLRRLDKRRIVFGASHHGYRFRPPLTTRQVETFEAAHAVSLRTGLGARHAAWLTTITARSCKNIAELNAVPDRSGTTRKFDGSPASGSFKQESPERHFPVGRQTDVQFCYSTSGDHCARMIA
jgi:hypothetical protein